MVFDLAIAIKELIENSLDSSASTIEIRLTDYGMTSIVVNDNGCGVLERDFNSLGISDMSFIKLIHFQSYSSQH